MIFSKPIILACAFLIPTVFGGGGNGAYEISIGGQSFQVQVVSPEGENFVDRKKNTDDFGQPLDPQKSALCSSLRVGDNGCPQVTNNRAMTHNLFNYFPNHADNSMAAYANDQFNKNKSPHLMRQPMDERTQKYFSRQNVHNLGTSPIKSKNYLPVSSSSTLSGITNSLLGVGDDALFSADNLKFVKSKTFKTKKKKTTAKESAARDSEIGSDEISKNQEVETSTGKDTKLNLDKERSVNDKNKDSEYEEIEVDFYSNFEDAELGDTVDRVINQLVASYLDNESGEEVDISQIFSNELMEEVNLDDKTMAEMNDLLSLIAPKQKKKESAKIKADGTNSVNVIDKSENDKEGEVKMYAFKFEIPSDIKGKMEEKKDDKVESNNERLMKKEDIE